MVVERSERVLRLVLVDPLGLDFPAYPAADLECLAEAGHSPMRDKRETFQQGVHSFLIGQEQEGDTEALRTAENTV